jgi:two-component system OmpR family sensor kinase
MALTRHVPRWLTVTTGMSIVLAITAVLGWLGEAYPTACLAVTTSPTARWTLTAVWLLGPLLVITSALRERSDTAYRIGLGLEIVAVAHALRVNRGDPAVTLGLSFSIMRFVGVLLLLAVAVSVTRRCFTSVDRDNREEQEALRHAEVTLQRVRERDHELRNGLAGLAGAARSLAPEDGLPDALHRAMAAELARLNLIMKTAVVEAEDRDRSSEARGHRSDEVLAD